jgi:single-strand DNA-binding protein
MYLNSVTLTGFIGGDAESRTSKDGKVNFTIFSLATKNSWKDRESGEWVSRTEWHRAIAFGKLAEMAGTLLKGDHVQIQGHLQTREYQKPAEGKKKTADKQRSTQIRVVSILKIERIQNRDEAQPAAQEVA